MSEGREAADILAEWREAERLAGDANNPAARSEHLSRAEQLRVEYSRRLAELDEIADDLGKPPGLPAQPSRSVDGDAFA